MRRISPPPSRVTPQLLLWDALRPFSQTLSTAATALAFIVKRMVAFVIIVLQGQEELVRQGILAGTFMNTVSIFFYLFSSDGLWCFVPGILMGLLRTFLSALVVDDAAKMVSASFPFLSVKLISFAALFPLDVIRTKLFLNLQGQYHDVYDIVTSVGPSGLYAGFLPALASAWAYAYLYDHITKALKPMREDQSPTSDSDVVDSKSGSLKPEVDYLSWFPAPDHLTLIAIALRFLLLPLDTVSVRMIAAAGGPLPYTSVWEVVEQTGFFGLWCSN